MLFRKAMIAWAMVLGFGFLGLIGGATTSNTMMPKTEPPLSITEIKTRAKLIPYDELARWPAKYIGEFVRIEGKVIQRVEGQGRVMLRINVAPEDYSVSRIIYLDGRNADGRNAPRVLEGDKVMCWGKFTGLTSYNAVFGQTITIPSLHAHACESQGRYMRR